MKKTPKTPKAITPEATDFQNLFLRTMADFENYKRRVEADKSNWTDSAKIDFMHALLPVLDNLVLMTEHQPEDLKDNSWVQGVSLIAKQIEETLQSEGIEKIIPIVGEDFNPNTEEAVSALEDKKYKPGQIVKVQKPGYKISDKIIRVAQVITSK